MLGIPEGKQKADEPIEPNRTPVNKVGKTLQPTDPTIKLGESVEAEVVRPKIDAASIYPEVTKDIEPIPSIGSNAQFALKTTEKVYEENNRPVSMRVKSLLVLGILYIISLVPYLVVIYFSASSTGRSIMFGVVLLQLALSVYLLFSKSASGVALLLKIFLVLQLINLVLSFVNPVALILNAIMAAFLFYVYGSVKSLR
jgi:hypothetical protein